MRTPDFSGLWQQGKKVTLSIALTAIATITLFLFSDLAVPQSAAAYPFWAQQTAPETPREATGRIVCANCHSGQKPAEIEIPQSVLPDTVFEAVVKIPYDLSSQQVLADGSKGGLNVGAVLMLPDGFKIPAGPDLIVSEGQTVEAAEALTNNPNVGGFGQKDTEVVLQNPTRIKFLILFLAGIMLAQILLVVKKRQIEKVQAAELEF